MPPSLMCSAAPGHRLRPRPQHTQGWWAPPCGPSAGSPCLACLEAGSCVPGSGSRGGAGGAGSRRRPHLMSGARGIRWKILLGRVGGRSIREGAFCPSPERSPKLAFVPWWGFSGGSDSKNSACNAGDPGSISELGRSLGEGNGYPLQDSCWRIPQTEEPDGLQSMGLQSRKRLNDFPPLPLGVCSHTRWPLRRDNLAVYF